MSLVFHDINGKLVKIPRDLNEITLDIWEDIVTGHIDAYEVIVTGPSEIISYFVDKATYEVFSEYLDSIK